MKARRSDRVRALTRRLTQLDDASIDELYGLEPVFEPDAPPHNDEALEVVSILCPYCWEHYETRVDLSAGSFTYVEDCQVCCQPIELSCEVSDGGQLIGVRPERTD